MACRHPWNRERGAPSHFFLFPLAVALVSAGASCGLTDTAVPQDPGPEAGDLRVLFIGASYLAVNDLPGIFEGMAEAAGKAVYVGRRVQPGFYLDFFAQDVETARAIRSREWDFVVLSGGCQTAAYPDTHHVIMPSWGNHHPLPALRELKRKIGENRSETVVVYMLPWAFEDGLTWVAGQSDDYFAMQEKIRVNALAWADSLDLAIAPVGMAWNTVMTWEVPPHYLHMSDWNHPAPRGSFLSAVTLFATLFQESAEGVDYRWLLSDADALAFRRVGSATVLNDLEGWHIR